MSKFNYRDSREHEIEEHGLCLVLPSNEGPGVGAVVRAVYIARDADVDHGEAVGHGQVAPRLAADDAASDGPEYVYNS